MKDRIKQLMLTQHMTQQSFAEVLGLSAASLSNIFNDRTKPTLNHVDAIKNRFPSINLDWLLYGSGPMYLDQQVETQPERQAMPSYPEEPQLDFGDLDSGNTNQYPERTVPVRVNKDHFAEEKFIPKNFDKNPRTISEIRIFYSDQTWETFVPKK